MTEPTNTAVDLFSVFATDEAAEENGIETTLPMCGETLFTVARSNSPAYLKLVQKLAAQNKAILASDTPASKAKNKELMARVFAETILLGWQGTINYKGEALTYSKENAKLLLSHPEFLAKVREVSDDYKTFLVVKDAEDEKN